MNVKWVAAAALLGVSQRIRQIARELRNCIIFVYHQNES